MNMAAWESCQRDISMDQLLDVYTLPISQKPSFESRPRGCSVLSCALPGIRHTSGESRTVIFSQRAPNVVREGAYVFVPDGTS